MELKKSVEVGERYNIAGVEHEVIAVDQDAVLFGDVFYARRFLVTLEEVLIKINRGLYRLIQAAPGSMGKAVLYLSLDEKQQSELQRKLNYVNAVSLEFNGRFPKLATKAFVADYALEINDPKPPGYTTLKKWIDLFQKSNGSPLSLVPKDKNRKPSGKRLDKHVADLIKHYIDTRFLTSERASVQSIVNSIFAQIKIDNTHRPPTEQIKLPGRATIYRHVNKLDAFLRDQARLGPAEARKRHKYTKKLRKAVRLLQRVEMDSHCIDLQIVNAEGKVLGRPWLCTAIETLTGIIQGWEISMTPPCAEKTLRVLKQCFSSKNPFGGKAENYYVDNGSEFQNSPVINLLNLYNSKITFVPPKSPDQKPMIERFFGTLNTQLIHQMPGTTRSNPVDRGDYNSEARARITLPKLRAYFEEWVTTVYHVANYGDRYISPNHAWERESKEGLPPMRYSDDELNLVCRCFETRKISGGRVTIQNMSWYGPGLPTLASKLGDTHARVYYDPTDLGSVYVADPSNPTYMVKADATDPEYQNGLTIYEHKLVRKALTDASCKFSQEAALIALASIQERIAAESDLPTKKKKKEKPENKKPKTNVEAPTDSQIRKYNLELFKLEQAQSATSPDEDDSDDFGSFSLDS